MAKYKKELKTFVKIMDGKLHENLRKPHWRTLSNTQLLLLLDQEILELKEAIKNNYTISHIQRECADVANFAMMISDNTEIDIDG